MFSDASFFSELKNEFTTEYKPASSSEMVEANTGRLRTAHIVDQHRHTSFENAGTMKAMAW